MPSPLPLPGALVWIRRRRWRIARAVRRRNVLRLDVEHRDRRMTFLAPFDRPTLVERPRRWRRARWQHALARLSAIIARLPGPRAMLAAVDARVILLPHQLEPALAVIGGARRVLVADAVGLGKTIQAGFTVAELVARDPAARVLVVVPAALRTQWRAELERRFALAPVDADRPGLDALAREAWTDANPWSRPGVWLASVDFLKQPHVRDALPMTPWDAVVVDEAHDVCGNSDRHEATDMVARHARHVLLLTATPHSGDSTRFERLRTLGCLGRDDPLVVFRRTRRDIGGRDERRVRWLRVCPDADQLALLEALTTFERAVLASRGVKRDAALLLLAVFRKRALSTCGALATSLDRRLTIVDLDGGGELDWMHQPSLAFDLEPEDDVDEATRQTLVADIGFDRRQERSWLRRLRTLAGRAARREPKIVRLEALVARTGEPVVVFTEFRRSLEIAAARLERLRTVAVLHGGQTPVDRRRELARFLDGPADVLVATDVAGQGLNLHERARWVVSLELPWNPVRLEQRVGRVDRIGQTRNPHLTVLVARHAAEDGLLGKLARRALVARESIAKTEIDLPSPDEKAVAASLLGGEPLATPAAPRLQVCRYWTRPARVVARSIARRRALSVRWRAPLSAGARPILTRAGRSAAVPPSGARFLLAFSVPLVDGAGVDVERRLVAVGIGRQVPVLTHELVREAAHVAERMAASRARALARRMARRTSAQLAVERAIALDLLRARCPEETDLGLFDRRELRAFEAARRDSDEIRRMLSDHTKAIEARSRISVGNASLELIFDAGPP